MNRKAFRIFGGTALMLSAAVAAVLPAAVQAAPARVRVAGTAKVNITNVPTVNLNGTPTVRLETGSAVSLQPGTTVSLPPDATVGLQPGAAVSLQPGSTVGLQPGSTVSLPAGTKVGLEAGTTVKVDPTSVVSVTDAGARQAAQMRFTFMMPNGEFNDTEFLIVEDNKILVVEYLSCSALLAAGTIFAELATTAGGVSAMYSFFPSPGFQDGAMNRVIISASTRLYAIPTPAPTLTVSRTNSAGSASIPCSLSGYYVDA